MNSYMLYLKYKVKGLNESGFTLLELLVVLAISGILLVYSLPSLLLLGSTDLNASGREFDDFLNLCRSEAISQRTAIRLGIVVKSDKAEEQFRQYAAWKWDKKLREFKQHSEWRSLPANLLFLEHLPRQAQKANYAEMEPSSIRGDHILDKSAEGFEYLSPASGEIKTLRFLEFSPSGRAQVPWGEERNLILAISSKNFNLHDMKNWVHFTVDTLTGRTRVYRP